MLNTYGNYRVIVGAGQAEIEHAEEEMRQQALSFLRDMGQPLCKMKDVEIIVKQYGAEAGYGLLTKATVGWKVAL